MSTTNTKSYIALIDHKNFSIKKYKHRFVKSFLTLSDTYVKSSFNRDDRIKVGTSIYESFFSKKIINLTLELEYLLHYVKKESSLKDLLSDLFFSFLSDYSQSFIKYPSQWNTIGTITNAIDAFISKYGMITAKKKVAPAQDGIDVMPDDMAISFLENLRLKAKPIRVLNTYRGIPLEFNAKVVHTSANRVLIKAHMLQDIAAVYQGGIYILCENAFGYDLYAKVKPRIIKGHDLLELSQFDQLTSGIHKRQTVRVYPEVKTTILVNNFTATLFDLSVGGIAVVSTRDFKLDLYEMVTIKIPDMLCAKVLHIDAELIHVSRFENGYKYHFKLDLPPMIESDISKYIITRQKEIIAELKEKLI
jgi:hypothetical protein